MTEARRRYAALRGESIAREFGFDDLPVDPFEIARQRGIALMPLDSSGDGISGSLVFLDTGDGILYRRSPSNPGFERFSVAHELGHYFLDGHPEMIQRRGGAHWSHAGFQDSRDPLEVEADLFATGLLLATEPVVSLLRTAPAGLAAIRALKERAQVSLTSAAFRVAPLAPYPMAVIRSKGEQVDCCFLSKPMRDMGWFRSPRRGEVLPQTATREFNADPANVAKGQHWCRATTTAEWFGLVRSYPLQEEIIGLGRMDSTLTVLWGDPF